jgi:hypothetical protein
VHGRSKGMVDRLRLTPKALDPAQVLRERS